MNSNSAEEKDMDCDITRFSLDGIVAEMVIEVDEHEQHDITPKPLKVDGLEGGKEETSGVKNDSVVDSDNQSEVEIVEKIDEIQVLKELDGKDSLPNTVETEQNRLDEIEMMEIDKEEHEINTEVTDRLEVTDKLEVSEIDCDTLKVVEIDSDLSETNEIDSDKSKTVINHDKFNENDCNSDTNEINCNNMNRTEFDLDKTYSSEIAFDKPKVIEIDCDETEATETDFIKSVESEIDSDKSLRNEPNSDESVRIEPNSDESVRIEPNSDEYVRNEPSSDESVRNEPNSDESVRNEPNSDESVRNESDSDDSIRNERNDDESLKIDVDEELPKETKVMEENPLETGVNYDRVKLRERKQKIDAQEPAKAIDEIDGLLDDESKRISTRGRKRKLIDTEIDKNETPTKIVVKETKYAMRKRQQSFDASATKPEQEEIQKPLRKLRHEKNEAATNVPESKSKESWVTDVGGGTGMRLSSIPEVRKQVYKAKYNKSLRFLYRLLFYQWPPNEGQELQNHILQFNGFPFGKNSFELVKRRRILCFMSDSTITDICKLLGLYIGPKREMIFNILEFLLKPHKTLDPAIDLSMQPYVKLIKLSLDNKYLPYTIKNDVSETLPVNKDGQESPKLNTPKSTARKSKRFFKKSAKSSEAKKSPLKKKIESNKRSPVKRKETPYERDSDMVKGDTKVVKDDLPQTMKLNSRLTRSDLKKTVQNPVKSDQLQGKSNSKPVKSDAKPVKSDAKPVKSDAKPVKSDAKPVKSDAKPVKSDKKLAKSDSELIKSDLRSLKSDSKPVKSDSKPVKSDSLSMKADSKSMKPDSKIVKTDSKPVKYTKSAKLDFKPLKSDVKPVKSSPKNTRSESKRKQETPKHESKPQQDSDKKPIENLYQDFLQNLPSDESACSTVDENVSDAATPKKVSPKKQGQVRKGWAVPLRKFPKISASIKKANFSALQRLHILLFGASDKAENLKGNILAFGGFPFVEGSEEWKQKHFLLSLLAQNTLREYLNLLCIEYSDDDQPTMISKLMNFLARPDESLLENDNDNEAGIPDIETEVVSSELTNNAPAQDPPKGTSQKKKQLKKKKKVKPETKRPRKVLMSEMEYRRLEADIAREQRIHAREKKLIEEKRKKSAAYHAVDINTPKTIKEKMPMKADITKNKKFVRVKSPYDVDVMEGMQGITPKKQPMTDPEQLNALLQTVYKRRALKAAGAVISTPQKGEKTKLGDLPNVKFLVVTANYSDLDVLHHLIYMADAVKSKVRKNILDFDGFGFTEDSKKYQDRMDFLNGLGYDVSKRLAFLLGLCPFQTNIPQQDLNELIMYFLMSPCKTKQVPITQMPHALFNSDVKELNFVVLKQNENSDALFSIDGNPVVIKSPDSILQNKGSKVHIIPPIQKVIKSPPIVTLGQKAKKSLTSSTPKLSPVKKVILSNLPSSSNKTIVTPTTTVASSAGKIMQPQLLLPQPSTPSTVQMQPTLLQSSQMAYQKSFLKPSMVTQNVMQPQEFLLQQSTPDGQQKTYKLLRFPSNQPLVIPPPQPVPQVQTQTVSVGSPIPGSTLPSGIILLKNNPSTMAPTQAFQNILQTVPIVINRQDNKPSGPAILPNFKPNVPASNKEEYVLPDEGSSEHPVADDAWNNDPVEVLHPLEDNPPTDEQLFESIQEIIHSSNFEDITLRNVIDRVAAQFSAFDLTDRHNFMKECVKRIIIGT